MTWDPLKWEKDFDAEIHKILDTLKEDLAQKVRSGRVAPALVDSIRVRTALGESKAIKALASIDVADAHTLLVRVWDRINTKAVEAALSQSDLGLSVSSETGSVRVKVPVVDDKRRAQMQKVAHDCSESSKLQVRFHRQILREAIKAVQKQHSKDDVERWNKKVDEKAKKAEAETDALVAKKIQEVFQ